MYVWLKILAGLLVGAALGHAVVGAEEVVRGRLQMWSWVETGDDGRPWMVVPVELEDGRVIRVAHPHSQSPPYMAWPVTDVVTVTRRHRFWSETPTAWGIRGKGLLAWLTR